MIPSKRLIYFLIDTPTGKAYYKDTTGVIQKVNISAAGFPVNLKNSPDNWIQTSFAFDRNLTYFGINRAYGTAQGFVREVREMLEELTLTGLGTEQPLSLATFIYNQFPLAGEPVYKHYYTCPLDTPEAAVTMFETFTCNLMEGGVAQLLKNYENTPLSIPCDGSLPEHIKANYDGMLFPDRFFYAITPLRNDAVTCIMGCTYLNNEGDNFGIVHGDQSFENISAGYPSILYTSSNYLFYSVNPIKVRVQGNIVVRGVPGTSVPRVETLQWYTSANNFGFIIFQVYDENSIDFDFTINLAPNEKLFLVLSNVLSPYYDIVGGSFSISFSSKPHDSRAWGLTAYNLWLLIGKQICQIASTTGYPISYDFESTLLQQYLNFFICSGDALRASNDPTYQRYYFIDENNNTQFGPVIKITLKQFFESVKLPTFAAVGKSFNPTTFADVLFFEGMRTVFDSSVVNYSLGEVSKVNYMLHSKDFRFSDLSIGCPPQTYDQKAGKYEWNTRLKMKAPIKSFEQPLTFDSYIRFDPYGIERLRAGAEVGASTSTTRNDSDNSVFLTVVDRLTFIYDYFRAQFISLISNDTDPNNTNIHFVPQQDYQKFDMPITDGEYFAVNKDFGIFVFSVPGYSATESTNIKMDAVANSVNRSPLQPLDTVTVKYWRNGVVLYQNTTTITGVNTVIDPTGLGSVGGVTFSQAYAHGDCIYITIETSVTAEVNINTVDLAIGTYVTMSGANIPVLGGTSQKVVSMPTVLPPSIPYDGSSKVQTGYQYFQYNSLAFSNNFDVALGLNGYVDGQAISYRFDMWINGVIASSYIGTGTVARSFFVQQTPTINRNFLLNDIVFFTYSTQGASLNTSLKTSTATWTSTYVKCYNLYRLQYDSLQGLPLLVTDSAGNFRTDLPGCPYNIEYVSPARLRDMWMPFLNSCFFDNVTGDMLFQTLDKNQFLSTTINGVTITEADNKTLSTNDRLFYPIEISFEFKAPLTFAEKQNKLSNAHVEIFIGGEQFFVHILHIEEKVALNDTTTCRGLLSSRTNLSTFAKVTGFKLNI